MNYNIKVTDKIITGCGKMLTLVVNGKNLASIIESPFGNCQSWCIRNFNHVIAELKPEDMKEAIKLIKEASFISKPLLVVDLNRNYYDRIKQHLVFNSITPYTSSNGSDMIMCIIDTRK
jgi:hypothetical protein